MVQEQRLQKSAMVQTVYSIPKFNEGGNMNQKIKTEKAFYGALRRKRMTDDFEVLNARIQTNYFIETVILPFGPLIVAGIINNGGGIIMN